MTDTAGTPQIIAAAQLLTAARRSAQPLVDLAHLAPSDETHAYRIADRHAEQFGEDLVGWKVGCTSEEAMRILDAPGPFAGRIFDGTVFKTGVVDDSVIPNPMLECEFAFMIGSDLVPRAEPYSVEDVRAATDAVSPAIELVGPRFQEMTSVHYLSLVADSGANAGAVLGDPVPVADVPDLDSLRVRCEVDGEERGTGTGADILGDPWNALAWLVNNLSSRELTLHAGQFVLSGTCTGITPLPPGSSARADHGDLGEVRVSRPA